MRYPTRREIMARTAPKATRRPRGRQAEPPAPAGCGGAAPRAAAEGKMEGASDPRYRGYRWKQLRARIIAERGRCEGPCKGYEAAAYLDHRIEVRDDTSDANFFDPANLQALGASCHGVKSAAERARRKGQPYTPPEPRCKIDARTGLPVEGSGHWWSDPDWGKRK